VDGDLAGRNKMEFLSRHKFGIHGKENEPFGITIAEMVKAGCIVWVPKGGGQVEIVNQAALIYNDRDDAAVKIGAVVASAERQGRLREHLARQASRFSAGLFMTTIRDIVRDELSEKRRDDPGQHSA